MEYNLVQVFMKCEMCENTWYYGDNNAGRKGNIEYVPCECRDKLPKLGEISTEELKEHNRIIFGYHNNNIPVYEKEQVNNTVYRKLRNE